MPPAGRSPRARLIDMLEAIEGIGAAVAGLDFQDFAGDWLLQRGVERGLEIISEASRHVPAATQATHPGVPWRQIAGIGNVLPHEYQRVEPRLIWNVVTQHMAPLDPTGSARAFRRFVAPSWPRRACPGYKRRKFWEKTS